MPCTPLYLYSVCTADIWPTPSLGPLHTNDWQLCEGNDQTVNVGSDPATKDLPPRHVLPCNVAWLYVFAERPATESPIQWHQYITMLIYSHVLALIVALATKKESSAIWFAFLRIIPPTCSADNACIRHTSFSAPRPVLHHNIHN